MCKTMSLTLFVAVFHLIFVTSAYQIQIPNYEMLRTQHILSQNYTFQFYDEIEKPQQQLAAGQFSERKRMKMYFQMFLYPYRVYSYFDLSNKKQYILRKVGYEEFKRQPQSLQNQLTEEQSIIKSTLNIKSCLFGFPALQINKKQCLSQYQLYSLIPQLLVFVQQDHEILELQKINQKYLLIKNHANPSTKHELSYFLNLDLFRVSFHSYIYEARLTLMKAIFDENQIRKAKAYERMIAQKNLKENDSGEKKNSLQVLDDQQQLTDQEQLITVDPDQIASEDPFSAFDKKIGQNFQIKMRDFFKSQRQIWLYLHQKNRAIFSNLFSFQKSTSVQKDTKFDYVASSQTFYFVQIDQKKCPNSNHKKRDILQNSQDQKQKQSKKQPNCTHLTIHKVPFIQFQTPQPIQYITQQRFFNKVQQVSLGYAQKQQSQQYSGLNQAQLLIHIMTAEKKVYISYGDMWKQIFSEDRVRPQTSNDPQDNFPQKVFFLKSLTKVEVNSNNVVIYGKNKRIVEGFVEQCRLKIQPFTLTATKLNNQLFVVCAEGSKCMIINEKCEVVNQIRLQNALGVQWKYRVNFVEDRILSFVTATKASEKLHEVIGVGIDYDQLYLNNQKTGQFYQKFQSTQMSTGNYKIKENLLKSLVKKKQAGDYLQLDVSFELNTKPYQYYQPEMFSDEIYRSFYKFKQSFLDDVAFDFLQEIFEEFYFPNFTAINQNETVEFMNFNEKNAFERYFNDCSYIEDKGIIHFQHMWSGCKFVIITTSLMVADPFQTGSHQQLEIAKPDDLSEDGQSKKQVSQPMPLPEKDNSGSLKQVIEIFTKQSIDPDLNKMVVCSSHRNSPPYSKCKVTQYEITKNFYDGKRKVKFFFEGSRYFQVYFFNRKFLTESRNQSFLSTLEYLARQKFSKLDESNKRQSQVKQPQLKEYKIKYPLSLLKKPQDQKHVDITLSDYQKIQIQNVSRILLITVCILFPTLTVCCIIVCFKSFFQNVLIYYGVISIQPSFRYPLDKLGLKIKMRNLQNDGYAKIHKNKRKHQDLENTDNSQTKFSYECCFCLEELKYNEEVVQLYCKHQFHSQCFVQWVRNEPNTKCPLCKRSFTKSALSQFKAPTNNPPSPVRPVRQFSQQSQNLQQQLPFPQPSQVQMADLNHMLSQ